jgi:MFS family permease
MSTQLPGSKPTNIRWLIVLLLVGFAFLAHFNRISMSVVGSERFIGPNKLSEEQMGLVYSAFLLVYTIGMLPGGYLIDRLGPRWAMAGMGLGMGFLTALTGMTGWFGLSIAALLLPFLVTANQAGSACIWEVIAEESRLPAEIVRFAEILSTSRLQPQGGLTPLGPRDYVETWRAVKKK